MGEINFPSFCHWKMKFSCKLIQVFVDCWCWATYCLSFHIIFVRKNWNIVWHMRERMACVHFPLRGFSPKTAFLITLEALFEQFSSFKWLQRPNMVAFLSKDIHPNLNSKQSPTKMQINMTTSSSLIFPILWTHIWISGWGHWGHWGHGPLCVSVDNRK